VSVSPAELSSLASSLDELTKRVATAASEAQAAGSEMVAADLYEIERSLTTAQRRLARILKPGFR
jgi:outer membrane murein-binding lipoprotein Lpp